MYGRQPWCQHDQAVRRATFSAETPIFVAHAMGLGAGPMIGIDQDKVAAQFGLAENEIPVMPLAVGYPCLRIGRKNHDAHSSRYWI